MPRQNAPLATRIRSGGGRLTKQKLLVAELLAEAKQALSAQEVYARLHARRPGLGRATVYRALEEQVAGGMAQRLEREGHVYAYVACSPEHHHHVVCARCGRSADIDETLVRPLIRSVRRETGFDVDHARLDLYGLCARCASAPVRARG